MEDGNHWASFQEMKKLQEECQAVNNTHTRREPQPKPGPVLGQQQMPLSSQPPSQSRHQGLNQCSSGQGIQGAPMPCPQLGSTGTQCVADVFNSVNGKFQGGQKTLPGLVSEGWEQPKESSSLPSSTP